MPLWHRQSHHTHTQGLPTRAKSGDPQTVCATGSGLLIRTFGILLRQVLHQTRSLGPTPCDTNIIALRLHLASGIPHWFLRQTFFGSSHKRPSTRPSHRLLNPASDSSAHRPCKFCIHYLSIALGASRASRVRIAALQRRHDDTTTELNAKRTHGLAPSSSHLASR